MSVNSTIPAAGTIYNFDSGKFDPLKFLHVADDEAAVNFDPRSERKADKSLAESMAVQIDPVSGATQPGRMITPMRCTPRADWTPETPHFEVNAGRQRRSALPECNKIRKSHKFAPLIFPIMVEAATAEQSVDDNLIDNEFRFQSTIREQMAEAQRMQDRGYSDELIAKRLGNRPLSWTRDLLYCLPQCDDEIISMVESGEASLAAVAECVRKAPEGVTAEMRRLVTEAAGGKVTKAKVQNKNGNTRLGNKTAQELISKLKTSTIKGEHGDAARHAVILAFEICLDARKADDLFEHLHDIAKGRFPKYEVAKAAEPEAKAAPKAAKK